MNKNLKAFLAKAREDKAWFDQLRAIEDKQAAVEACLAKAADLGLALAPEDFGPEEGSLSDDELAAVAGAGYCACALGGGGTSDDGGVEANCSRSGHVDRVCACVVYGEGWTDEYYNGVWDEETQRCNCPMVGVGEWEEPGFV